MIKTNKFIVRSNLFFIKKIKEILKNKKWNINSNKNETISVDTDEFEYCYKVNKTVEKHLSNDKWQLKMTSYYKTSDKFYYVFQMKLK